MVTLNLVMIVKNEERCLKRCLESVMDLVDTIIIVDTGSSDKTKDIASFFGAKVYDFTWISDFSAARNYGLEQSDADWNLVLDADEYLTNGTRDGINQFLKNKGQLGAIKIINAYEDNGEISYGIDYTTRLLPQGIKFVGMIHEQVDSDLPRHPLSLAFDHDGYLMPNKGERNFPILLNELDKNPEDTYVLYQLGITLRNMERFGEAIIYFRKFYLNVNINANYRRRGIVSFLYTLIELKEYDDVLELIEREKVNLSTYADFAFACGIFYMKLILSDTKKYISYLPRIEKSYLHCLEIGEVEQDGGILGTGSFKASYNLGVWYEVAGETEKAIKFYTKSAKAGYKMAIDRLEKIGR